MVTRLRSRLTYANVMSTIAVFAALGGGAYAAVKLPRNSVGSAQIKANAVSSSKVKDGSLTSSDFASGQLPAGGQGATGPEGPKGADGATGAAGKDGAPGTNGTNGTDGTDGVPGSARAYAHVVGSGAFSRSKNVVAVTKPATTTGIYCIQLNPSIDVATAGLVVSNDYATDSTSITASGSNTEDKSIAEWRSNVTDCSTVPGTLEVRTATQTFTAGALVGNVASDQPFFFVVP